MSYIKFLFYFYIKPIVEQSYQNTPNTVFSRNIVNIHYILPQTLEVQGRFHGKDHYNAHR